MNGPRAALATSGLLVLLALLAAAPAAAQMVEARLDRRRLAVGETTTLRVIVRAGAGVRPPVFDVPPGLTVISSGRQQSFSWVNGRASNEHEFRYEIEAGERGRYMLGPIVVTVGSQNYRSGTLILEVGDAPALSSGGGGAPASLHVVVEPRDPYVGQEMRLRVRLVQRASFAEDPQYTPPTTTGFWTDRPTSPESFYAEERGQRVLVTETVTRLYPLATGEAVVGEASAQVVLAEGSGPFGWLVGERRELQLRSAPVTVRVRPLPDGAPPGFTGAVGRFATSWTADRFRTSRDVPVTVRLDVRGQGNLPLVRPPRFADADVDVFASTVEDSLPTPGSEGRGRKRFQWTLLAKREGPLEISAPSFSWFDPEAEDYRRAALAPLSIDVDPPVFTSAGAEAGFPRVLADRPVDPGARGPTPWMYALAGLALGAAIQTWRRGAPPPRYRHEVEPLRERLASARGAAIWAAAEDALGWVEALPHPPANAQSLRQHVAAARYGGGSGDPQSVRRDVLALLARLAPRPAGGFPTRLAALGLLALGIALGLAGAPRSGRERWAQQSAAADQAARRGELDRARAVWAQLWRSSGGHPGLAARIGWTYIQEGAIGPAALWVLRGELIEPRDPGVAWVSERVREAGGLVGASGPRWPVRRLEWSVAALLLGLGATLSWPRRTPAAVCAALAIGMALVYPIQGWLAERSGRAVVLRPSPLEGSDIELEAGQMVMVRTREGPRVHVTAGRVVDGWVPATAVARVVPPRGLDA